MFFNSPDSLVSTCMLIDLFGMCKRNVQKKFYSKRRPIQLINIQIEEEEIRPFINKVYGPLFM